MMHCDPRFKYRSFIHLVASSVEVTLSFVFVAHRHQPFDGQRWWTSFTSSASAEPVVDGRPAATPAPVDEEEVTL